MTYSRKKISAISDSRHYDNTVILRSLEAETLKWKRHGPGQSGPGERKNGGLQGTPGRSVSAEAVRSWLALPSPARLMDGAMEQTERPFFTKLPFQSASKMKSYRKENPGSEAGSGGPVHPEKSEPLSQEGLPDVLPGKVHNVSLSRRGQNLRSGRLTGAPGSLR